MYALYGEVGGASVRTDARAVVKGDAWALRGVNHGVSFSLLMLGIGIVCGVEWGVVV